jgi:tetratricopeptide (TPR) repeat protein
MRYYMIVGLSAVVAMLLSRPAALTGQEVVGSIGGGAVAEWANEPDPEAAAYVTRGNAWFEKGDYDKAIENYSEAIRLQPNFAVAFHNRGLAWKRKQDYNRAIMDYSQVLRFDPENPRAYHDRGKARSSE